MYSNVKAERRALESTYSDLCTISRMEDVTDENNITRQEPVEVYQDVICALSAKGDSSKQTEAQHHLEYDRLLFIQPEIVINPGDQVMVKRFGRLDPNPPYIQTFQVIGMPVPYVTHTQAKLKAVGLG